MYHIKVDSKFVQNRYYNVPPLTNENDLKHTIFIDIDQIFLICAKIALPLWTIISISKEFLLFKSDNSRP